MRTESGVYGVITAAHCPAEVDWYIFNANPTEQYDLNLYYEFWDQNEDWQYMKQDGSNVHAVEPLFWNGLSYVTVTNGQPPSDSTMIGQTVCHLGRTTGRSCGEVYSPWFDPGFICGPSRNGDCQGTWVAVIPNGGTYPLECDGGDSGGPWFKGSRAYGLHTFGPRDGVCDLAVFMSLWYVENRPFVVLEG